MSELKIKPVESQDEERALQELGMQGFNFDEERWRSFLTIVDRNTMRVAVDDERVVGGLSFYPIGQWFGGKSVSMAALALVLVAPELRGRGYAHRMLSEVLRQLRADGYSLSTLYASTQQVYRKVGFQQAGNSYDYMSSIRDIEVPKQTLPMRRVDPQECRELMWDLATRRAMNEQGCLDRNEGMWRRLFRKLHGPVFTYLVGEPGNESGYLIYDQSRNATRSGLSEHAWEQRSINIRDMVALNEDAQTSIWAFVGGNRSVTELVTWSGPATDIRNVVTSEYEAKITRPVRWMMRLLNVQQAMLDRGYPEVDADIAFEVSDELIPENNGHFTLSLRGGEAQLVDGGDGCPIEITARELAPLYSGLWTADQLRRFGLLRCADDRAVNAAIAAFASSEPWMPDSF